MHFEDDFPFPKVGYVNPLEGNLYTFGVGSGSLQHQTCPPCGVPASLGSRRPERQVGPGSERGRERAHCLVFGEFSGGYLRSIEIFKLFHI